MLETYIVIIEYVISIFLLTEFIDFIQEHATDCTSHAHI